MLNDLRLALRTLAKYPGFTVGALLALALGIGANTSIFSVVDGVLLRPLPFEGSDELMALPRAGLTESDVSTLDGRDWRAAARSFEEIALFLPSWAFDLTGEGEPERLDGAVVEPRFFRVLRVKPLLGRTLTDDDDRPGGEGVAVISEGLWRRRFGGDPAVIGRTLTLSDRPWTVVGVVPDAVDFLASGVEIWVPVAVATPWALDQRGTNNFEAIGRLAPGVPLERAQAEMVALTKRLAAEYPDTNRTKIIRPVPLQDLLVGRVRPALLVLLGAVGLVLLITCANLAGLLAVRAIRRRGEVATRLALGAGRVRIARQLLAESALLAVGGGALGCLVAVWGTDLLLRLAPVDLPRAQGIGLSPPVLAFTAAVTLATAVVFGLLPAFQTAGGSALGVLQRRGFRASPGRRHQRSLGLLVAAEIAIAFLLLIGAGLLLRSFVELHRVDLGFEPTGVLEVNLVLPESRYGERGPQTRAFGQIVEAAAGLPGAASAGFAIGAPLADFGAIGHSLVFADRPAPPPEETPSARNRPVLGDYFTTLGIPILAGRGITGEDDARAPAVAVVNETFAKLYWPGESPLGKRLAWILGDGEPRWMTVVGIARDVKTTSLAAGDARTVYTSYLQREMDWQRFGTLVVRARPGVELAARQVREAVWSVDPTLPVPAVVPMEQRVAGSLARERFLLTLVLVFAAAALGIALQGIYSVLANAVAQRRSEIGVRVALGAGAGDVVRLVLRRGLLLTLAGGALGLTASLAVTRLLTELLFATRTTDPSTYLVVASLLAATTLLACLLPARRAARIAPAEALRAE